VKKVKSVQNDYKLQEYNDILGVPSLDVRNEFWSYGEFEVVGHGKRTNDDCGLFKKFMGCMNVEFHNAVRWFYPELGKNQIFVKKIYHSCDKPSCPVCYKYGWAPRAAGRIEKRLKVATKRFGLVEHIIASVPHREYHLGLEALRKRVVKILRRRGVIGGCMIFHAFRYRNKYVARKTDLSLGWYWNPHFHVLGFVGGSGYGRCRRCRGADCYACSGFEGITRREHEKDDWIVKVLEERKTVGGTAWYQLNHASVRRGSKKSHVSTWFGVVSYRKLKIENLGKVDVRSKCPICGCDLVRLHYLGDFPKLDVSKLGNFVDFYGEDGSPLWEISYYEGG
jgi:hypothetical protein